MKETEQIKKEIKGLQESIQTGLVSSSDLKEIIYQKLGEWDRALNGCCDSGSIENELFDLKERERELRCLYAVMSILQPVYAGEDDTVFKELVCRIPQGFMVAEETCVRLEIGEKWFESRKPSGKERGVLENKLRTEHGTEVLLKVYRFKQDDKPDIFETSKSFKKSDHLFLKEEEQLTEKIVELIVKALNYQESVLLLRDSEERYRTTLYSIGDAVITTDARGIIMQMNTVAERLTGWKEQEAQGKPVDEVFRIFNEDTGKPQINPVEKILRERKKVKLANHIILVNKNGKKIPIADCGAPVIGTENQLIGVVLIFRDQQKERKAQIKLEESEKKFRAMVEQAPEPIFIQTEFKFSYVNSATQKLYGAKSPEELIGTAILDRCHPDYHEFIKNRIKRLNVNREHVPEFSQQLHFKMDGSPVWVETSGTPIEFDGKKGGLVFLRVISFRKKAEEKLRESEEKYRSLFENSHTPMLISNPSDGMIIDANPAAEAFYGWNRRELRRMHTFDLNILSREEVLALMQEVKSGKKNTLYSCHRLKNGQVKEVEVFSGPITLEGNSFLYSIITDVTERKRYEKMVQDSLKEKKIMLSEIHHRVKNNLAVISGLLGLEAEMTENAALAEVLRKSDGRIRSMALVHEKLYERESFSKINFSDYVGELLSEIHKSYDNSSRIQKQIHLEPVILNMTAAVPCGIIINEIITNGIKHGLQNSREYSYALSIVEREGSIIVQYEDNGTGFSEEFLKNFEKGVFRSLGYQLIFGLVKQLKGAIKIWNQEGAKVDITFPAD
ncbi:PAS domain S-box protein [Balneolaceae bacterium ANBcel3]|nr:PAS domain S-box protein [Balneolaceae bacterium ANBcel3]